MFIMASGVEIQILLIGGAVAMLLLVLLYPISVKLNSRFDAKARLGLQAYLNAMEESPCSVTLCPPPSARFLLTMQKEERFFRLTYQDGSFRIARVRFSIIGNATFVEFVE